MTTPIKIVGVGDGGCNALPRILAENLAGIECIAINTQHVSMLRLPEALQTRLVIGNGLGTGGSPQVAKRAAEQGADLILDALRDASRIFILAGLGAGTGSGASSVVARLARETAAGVTAIVSMPFNFEGIARHQLAESAVMVLQPLVDALIVIDNNQLVFLAHNRKTPTLQDLFRLADAAMAWNVLARLTI